MPNKSARPAFRNCRLHEIKSIARELQEESGLKRHAALNMAAMKFGFNSYHESRCHLRWPIVYPQISTSVLVDNSSDFVSNALRIFLAKSGRPLLRGPASRTLPSKPRLTMVKDELTGAILAFTLSIYAT